MDRTSSEMAGPNSRAVASVSAAFRNSVELARATSAPLAASSRDGTTDALATPSAAFEHHLEWHGHRAYLAVTSDHGGCHLVAHVHSLHHAVEGRRTPYDALRAAVRSFWEDFRAIDAHLEDIA